MTLPINRFGVLLTPDQTRRLALLRSTSRESAIEAIAAHLRDVGRGAARGRKGKRSPRGWYGESRPETCSESNG